MSVSPIFLTYRAKAEEMLAVSEAKAEKQEKAVNDLTKQVEELQAQASEASKLRDRLDEYVFVLVAH